MTRFFLFILLFPILLFAQNNTQVIRGNVTDKWTQSPIPSVMIQIPTLELTVYSDSLGNYVFEGLKPDRYELKVSAEAYKPTSIPNVILTSGKEVIVDISMEEKFQQMKDVSVKVVNKSGATASGIIFWLSAR